MPKWKKDASEFDMRVVDDGKGSRYVRIPKPLDELMGQPISIRFEVSGKKITLSGAKN